MQIRNVIGKARYLARGESANSKPITGTVPNSLRITTQKFDVLPIEHRILIDCSEMPTRDPSDHGREARICSMKSQRVAILLQKKVAYARGAATKQVEDESVENVTAQ